MPEIFEFDFMIRALIGGSMVAILAPAFGLFIVLRRLSLIADTLSHVALMGVAIGFVTSIFPTFVALIATTSSAAGIEQLRSRGKLPGDAALAVFLYSSLAIAVIVISKSSGFNADLFGYLFGTVLSINDRDLWLIAVLLIVVILFVVSFYAELTQSAFDQDLAHTSGVRVTATNLALAILTGATVTASMRVVGVLMVGALIVIPVLAALRLARGFRTALVLAIVFGLLSVWVGLTVAFYADLAAGGSIVLTTVAMLILSEVLGRIRDSLPSRRTLVNPADDSSSASVQELDTAGE
ncbi:MAG: metal ABC transporter permease [Chloroflexi bacterium]|nr:metal ABC transporter permease [Chloroflexota bacterium]MBT4515370.1 metal ABC transporter permease [Chloroflexota bacterium]